MPEGPFCQIGAHLQFYDEHFCLSKPMEKTAAAANRGLTHLSLSSFYETLANCAVPDQTPQNAASDQVLHCLLSEYFFLKFE